jgi:uncharacterized protein YkwD
MRLSSIPLALLLATAALPAQALDLNGLRKANGLKPMRANGPLATLAKAHAADMARRQSMDHAGFFERRAPRGASGENVSVGCAEVSCAMLQWSNSSPHRANMLRPDFTRYGLGSATAASGQRYWAIEFGR